ncbi:MAG: GNAT family N-acetyltransferase [Gemmatimonadota bacterium]|nr:GNAT family N-acetyltransferase [Gemmatimonadota bacterium]
MGKPTWTVRPYRDGDEREAAALASEVFRTLRTPAEYRWKLFESPCPAPGSMAWYAESEGALVGQFAGTPVHLKIDDRVVTAVHGCDVLTRADFRGRGVLGSVGKAAFADWKSAGADCCYGLENENWGSQRRKLGLVPQLCLHLFVRPLDPGPWLRRHGVPAPLADAARRVWSRFMMPRSRAREEVTVDPVDVPGEEFDQLWTDLSAHYPVTVVRNRSWVTYRYAKSSGRPYRLALARREGHPVGYVAYRAPRAPGGLAQLADLFTHPADHGARRDLMTSALTELQATGASAMQAHIPEQLSLTATLDELGFLRRRRSYTAVVIPLARTEVRPAFGVPSSWFMMPGDSDIV